MKHHRLGASPLEVSAIGSDSIGWEITETRDIPWLLPSIRKGVARSQSNTQLPRFRSSAYARSSSASIRWAILAGIFVALFAMILILLANLFSSGSG